MLIPSALDMKKLLAILLESLLQESAVYFKSTVNLNSLGVKLNSSNKDLSAFVVNVVNFYFKSLNKDLTIAHANGTPAEIEIDPDYYTFERLPSGSYYKEDDGVSLNESFRLNLVRVENESIEDQREVIKDLLSRIQFKKIEDDLKANVDQLLNEGLKLIADGLVTSLGIDGKYDNTLIKAGFVICQTSSSVPNHYYKLLSTREFETKLRVVAKYTTIDFGNAHEKLNNALETTYKHDPIPSQTTFGKSNNLSIKCFKNRYDYILTYEAFDAIYAFVMMYGSKKSTDALSKVATQIEHVA